MEDSLAMATVYGLPAEAVNSITTIISAIRCGNLTRQQIHPYFRQFRGQPVRQPLAFTLGKDTSETTENLLRDISRHNGQCLTSQESLSLLASEKPTGREETSKHIVIKDTRLFFVFPTPAPECLMAMQNTLGLWSKLYGGMVTVLPEAAKDSLLFGNVCKSNRLMRKKLDVELPAVPLKNFPQLKSRTLHIEPAGYATLRKKSDNSGSKKIKTIYLPANNIYEVE